ncbi:MAG: nucleotidyltransferase domain-containing protein [Bacteroidota bacterium]
MNFSQATVLDDRLANTVAKLCDAFPEIIGIYLYGSRLLPDSLHDESDWDIGVLTEVKTLDQYQLWKLSSRLAADLGAAVDLVQLNAQDNLVLQWEVITNGKRIYTSNQYACDLFEATAMTKFLYFRESIRPLIQSAIQRFINYEPTASTE